MKPIVKEHILYVDDEKENLDGFKFLLHRDFNIHLATSAAEGFKNLRKHKIKVVLTDQRMPEISGIELLEQISKEFPDIIRIIVTAYGDTETILQSINVGKIFHFITKPWNNNELKIIISNAIETYNLKREKAELINYLQKTNIELFLAKLKAEKSDRLKSSFLANMLHEIRTPLNSILGFSNLLTSDIENMEMRKNFVNIIDNSANDLLNIIEDIIDASHIELGDVSISDNSVDIHKFMCDLLLVFQNHNLLKNKNVEFKYKYPKITDKKIVRTDALRLKQILSNLINNAIKFTEEGEVEIGYEIISNKEKKNIQFFVRDTGIGISPDMFEYIFERFGKIDTETNKYYKGNGLGLFIAKKLTQLLGGKIILKSKINKGSTFYVTIPYLEESKKSVKEPKSTIQFSKFSWPDKTILIVEDENSNYKYLETLLNKRVKLLWVNNGIDAVKACKEKKIDLVLMDIKLPKMDGYEATRKIKKIRPKLPVIAVTAYAMNVDKQQSIDAGCDNYISKPYKMEDLFSLINTYIR